jgi:hypothetical protein
VERWQDSITAPYYASSIMAVLSFLYKRATAEHARRHTAGATAAGLHVVYKLGNQLLRQPPRRHWGMALSGLDLGLFLHPCR